MPAECELIIASGKVCSVLAMGRCEQCERAYCRSHRISDRCSDCPPPQPPPSWHDQFEPTEYAEDVTADEEARARDVLVTVAVRVSHVSISEIRRRIDLGPRWPKLLSSGYYNQEPTPASEISKDKYAWSIICELVQFGLFTTHNLDVDRTILQNGFDSPTRREFEELGIYLKRGQVYFNLSGMASQGFLEGMLDALRSRRPSKSFIEAYRTFNAPILQAKQALAVLPSADYSALVRYIRSGAVLEPDEWSLKNGLRLEPVTWEILAKALAEAGIPFGPGGVTRKVRSWRGRERSNSFKGWVLATVRQETSRGIYDQVTRLLVPGGVVLDKDGAPEALAGKPHPTQIRDLVRLHLGN